MHDTTVRYTVSLSTTGTITLVRTARRYVQSPYGTLSSGADITRTHLGTIEDMPDYHACDEVGYDVDACCTPEDKAREDYVQWQDMRRIYRDEVVPLVEAAGYHHVTDTEDTVQYAGHIQAMEGDATHATIPAAWEEAFAG